MEEFILDDDGQVQLKALVTLDARWTEFPHAHQRMRGLVLLAGEKVTLPWLTAGRDPWLAMAFLRGLPEISEDGLELMVMLEVEGDAARLVGLAVLDNAMPAAGYREWECSLPVAGGARYRVEIQCGAGPRGRPEADWLALTALAVGPRQGNGRRMAKANHAWRLANEIAHFSSVYDREFYRDRHVQRSTRNLAPIRELPLPARDVGLQGDGLRMRLRDHPPVPGENAFGYAHRLLTRMLPAKPPGFAARLQEIHARDPGRPLRMLSLCAGEAATEGRLLVEAGVPVELCLLDVHEGLLETAARRMPDTVEVDRVLGDANALAGQLGRFDVINITSGLHHLVELERVLSGIARSLTAGGEFWLIGEQVGRNGNRLWSDAQQVADALFSAWPESKRRNANTGQLDDRIPGNDCSSACFEGIRSEEILGQLQRHFLPVDVYLRNCFLWRLFDVAYADNFDLGDADDVALVHEAVCAEVEHWAGGGLGTELHGVFRSKLAELC